MAEKINCDLRCGVCISGGRWDEIVPFVEERLTMVGKFTAKTTKMAEDVLGREVPPGPADHPYHEVRERLVDMTTGLSAGEAALRASLAGEFDRISQTDCVRAGECRLDPYGVAIADYYAQVLNLMRET